MCVREVGRSHWDDKVILERKEAQTLKICTENSVKKRKSSLQINYTSQEISTEGLFLTLSFFFFSCCGEKCPIFTEVSSIDSTSFMNQFARIWGAAYGKIWGWGTSTKEEGANHVCFRGHILRKPFAYSLAPTW